MLMPGMTVVVSPLIALMRDQVDKLSAFGLPAVQVNSAIPTAEVRRARAKIGRRSVEFIFTTPEQLAWPTCVNCWGTPRSIWSSSDEAHCISQAQDAFMRGNTPLIVATNTFDLGIDKPDIRRVIVLLDALGETVEWSQCHSCDNCRGLSIRSEAVPAGAA